MTQPASGPASGDAVDRYLDELADALVLRGRSVRRILAESEDHLREAVAEARQRGLEPAEAQDEAIRRFGTPAAVARRFAAAENRLPTALLAPALLSLCLVAGIGLVAIGVSGGVAAAMGAAAGKSFVAGDAPGVTYTAERCAEYRHLRPEAGSCEAAALAHHFDEVVGYRLDAGVVGVLVLGGWWLARRRRVRAGRAAALPPIFTSVTGLSLFGVAAAGLVAMSVLQSAFVDGAGAGELLSGGVVAAVVAAGFAVSLARSLRPPGDAVT